MSRSARIVSFSLAAFASLQVAAVTPSLAQDSKQAQRLLAMTPADFERAVSVKDDSLDTVAILTSEPGFQEKRGLLKIVSSDNFLRAFIDKKTGAVSYQIYQYISYSGDWRFYDTVNYETPQGPESKPVTRIARDVDYCGRYGCSESEHFGFEVPESLLRQLAAGAPIWRFKFSGRSSGQEWQDGMARAEIAGFLAAVDRYRVRYGAKPETVLVTPTTDPAVAPLEHTPTPPVAAVARPKPAPAPLPKKPAVVCITC